MGPFDNSACAAQKAEHIRVRCIRARGGNEAEKGGFDIRNPRLSFSRFFSLSLLSAGRATYEHPAFYELLGPRYATSGGISLVTEACDEIQLHALHRPDSLSLFLFLTRSRFLSLSLVPTYHAHNRRVSRETHVMYCTHTPSTPSVYRVSIPESTHEDDRERHRALYFLLLSSLFLFPSLYAYRTSPHSLSLSLFLSISYLMNGEALRSLWRPRKCTPRRTGCSIRAGGRVYVYIG